MKKTRFLMAGITVCAFFLSCSKESAVKQKTFASNTTDFKTVNESINNQASSFPKDFLGVYTVQDEKTIYIGQANPRGTNVLINLSYLQVPTYIKPLGDKKHLTMPYGAAAYPDSNWAYIISYNTASQQITLSPNEAMINDIVPNSFKVLLAIYDPKKKEGNFVTRFTALKDNGNETELSEAFFK